MTQPMTQLEQVREAAAQVCWDQAIFCIAVGDHDGAAFCEYLAGKIREMPLPELWLPMSTAPRDGTQVLLHVGGCITDAWYDPLVIRTDHEGADDSSGGSWCCAEDRWQIEVVEMHHPDGSIEYDDGEATEWMPMLLVPDFRRNFT